MRKVWLLIALLIFTGNCASIKGLVNGNNGTHSAEYFADYSLYGSEYEAAIADGKILEGMTTDMVKRSLGEPEHKIYTSNKLTVWVYGSRSLYFVDDILITWKDRNE